MGYFSPKIVYLTKHARERMELRDISKDDIKLTLKNPDIELDAGGGMVMAKKKFNVAEKMAREIHVIWKIENGRKLIITVHSNYQLIKEYGKIPNKIR